MARYKRIPQNLGGAKTFTAHRDLSDICPGCGGYILQGQWYVMKGRAAWHYRCKDLASQIPTEKPKPKKANNGTRAAQRQRRAERRARRQAVREQRGQERADMASRLDYAIDKD